MRPTKDNIQKVAKAYIKTDTAGNYILFEDAEKMLDIIFESFTGIMSQYSTRPINTEELIISTVARKSVLFRIRIKR